MTNKFTNGFKRGFTLIELLVVIAIIGILSSVVLASLNTARAKGSDAAVKSALSGVRAQAEIIYDDQKCYGDGAGSCVAFARGTCTFATADTLFNNSVVAAQIANAISNAGTYHSCVVIGAGTAWATVVQLKTDPLKAWCVDSTGQSKQETVLNSQAGLDAAGVVDANGKCV